MSDFPSRSTANPMSESIDHSWICRKDFGIERNQSFKENDGNAQFSLCCTSTAMPDDDSQDRHPAFCFWSQLKPRCSIAISGASRWNEATKAFANASMERRDLWRLLSKIFSARRAPLTKAIRYSQHVR